VTRLREMVAIAAVSVAAASWCAPAGAQEVPTAPDPVAQVGDVAITLADYERWFALAAHSTFGGPMKLVPPAYERCVASKRRLREAKHWAELDDGELRARCARDRRSLSRQVMQFLIQGQWIEQEAAVQEIEVGGPRVDRAFRRQKRAAFPDDHAYQRFLRESGSDEADIKHRIRLDLLQNLLTRRVTGRARPVTERDVARYRASHPGRFAGMSDRKARARARHLVGSLREQRMLLIFIDDFRGRWQAKTWCAPGYRIVECGAVARPS
jgi:hypothetical protein